MYELVYGLHERLPELFEVFAFADALVAFWVVAVDTVVHNAVQIHVKVVNFRNVLLLLNVLENHGIAARKPAEEFGNAHLLCVRMMIWRICVYPRGF